MLFVYSVSYSLTAVPELLFSYKDLEIFRIKPQELCIQGAMHFWLSDDGGRFSGWVFMG